VIHNNSIMFGIVHYLRCIYNIHDVSEDHSTSVSWWLVAIMLSDLLLLRLETNREKNRCTNYVQIRNSLARHSHKNQTRNEISESKQFDIRHPMRARKEIYRTDRKDHFTLESPNATQKSKMSDLEWGPSHTRVCIQKFPDWPPGARTANGIALCH
jgi:hypothetical protein